MPLKPLFPSSITKDGPEKPSDEHTYFEVDWAFWKLFMQYVELDGQGETSHNFIMIMYQQLDEDQSVESCGRIKYCMVTGN
jgi:hypothetical protein